MVDIRRIDERKFAEIMGDPPLRDPAPVDLLRDQIPKWARLEVPLDNQTNQRMYADILRQLAMALDLLSRRQDISETMCLMTVQAEVRNATLKCRAVTRSSKGR